MKRSLVVTLILVFMFSIANISLAATSPFEDVPTNHWAYEAVSKLAQAGIVDGYGNGTFQGDHTMTRYQMATVIANAMTKQNKANAEQKALIDKLASEFSSELEGLNVRVTKLENKASNIKFDGEVRYRYENTTSVAEQSFTRVRINMFAPLTDSLVFKGRIESQNSAGTKADINMTQAYIAGKAFGANPMVVGRIPLYLGQGLLTDSEGDATTGADGILLVFGNQLKVSLAAGKAGVTDDLVPVAPGVNMPGNLILRATNIAYAVNKDFNVTAAYLADKDKEYYKSYSAGFNYKGIKNVGLNFEYGVNKSELAKASNNNTEAKGWMAKAKYLGAIPETEKSYGFWVGYRNADTAFDSYSLGTLESTTKVNEMSNIKGFEYGVEYSVFRNGVLKFQYNDMKSKSSNTDQENYIGSLTYSF